MILNNMTFFWLTYKAKSCFNGPKIDYKHLVVKQGSTISIVTAKNCYFDKNACVNGTAALRILRIKTKKYERFNISNIKLTEVEA
mgnify:CR=1 FL=1